MITYRFDSPVVRQISAIGHSATSVLLPPDPAHVEAIRKSHERCAALGLSRISADYSPRARADLAIARERNHRLYVHAVPVMELLLEQILATKSMVVLVDAEGKILYQNQQVEFNETGLREVAQIVDCPWSDLVGVL